MRGFDEASKLWWEWAWCSTRKRSKHIGRNGMTFVSSYTIRPVQVGSGQAPCRLDLSDLSLVVPVYNNRHGVQRLLVACLDMFSPGRCPREIIIVDNLSTPPLTVPRFASWGLPLQVLSCRRPGTAAARNLGARTATGEWVLFLDSDCLPTPNLIEGYQRAINGAVAYAGVVRAAHGDPLSRYYDTQGIFSPPPVRHQGREHPAYLITANALVWRQALARVGGFDERFPNAGGEDVDLGLRLWRIGPLAYAPQAQVLHATEPRLGAFIRRFVRYGRANRLLSVRYQVDLTPQRFVPQRDTALNHVLADLQFAALWWGYVTTRPGRSWSVPSLEIPWRLDLE
ncbi:MAG TPA: glycosyltransferase [Ktedonobacteraceae bacterium]|nr:glycosyltransferase [Ktedonobacteraceae bacterium]